MIMARIKVKKRHKKMDVVQLAQLTSKLLASNTKKLKEIEVVLKLLTKKLTPKPIPPKKNARIVEN